MLESLWAGDCILVRLKEDVVMRMEVIKKTYMKLMARTMKLAPNPVSADWRSRYRFVLDWTSTNRYRSEKRNRGGAKERERRERERGWPEEMLVMAIDGGYGHARRATKASTFFVKSQSRERWGTKRKEEEKLMKRPSKNLWLAILAVGQRNRDL